MTTNPTRIGLTSLIIVFCILVLVPSAVIAQAGIVSVDISGEGVVMEEDGVVYLWDDASYEVSVRFQDFPDQENYLVCLDKYRDGSEEMCREASNLAEGEEATVYFNTYPEEAGQRQMRIRLHGDNFGYDNPKKDQEMVSVHFMRKNGDRDNDGLSNQEEVNSDFEVTNSDMDGDGLSDGDEMNQHNTDPTETDSDGDGLSDGDEVNGHNSDPSEMDSDGDGLSDEDEVNQHNANPTETDSDSDGLSDDEEVNEHNTDPSETDSDGDGLSDSNELNQHDTDPTESDSDMDGYSDGDEVNQSTDPTDSEDMPTEDDNSNSDDGDGDDGNDTNGDDGNDTDNGSTTQQPGFGIVITLVALVAAAILAVRRRL